LANAIESAAHGELRCNPKIAAVLVQRLSSLSAPSAQGPNLTLLTSREREIATLIEQGLSNKQIACQLHIEIATVKNHVHNILDKLRVTTRGEVGAQLRRTVPRRSLRPTPATPFPAPSLGL
jgi:DNA-binding NarL/FixJ family response regulator